MVGVIEPREVRLNDGRVATIRSLRPEDARAYIDQQIRSARASPFTVTRDDEVERDEIKRAEWIAQCRAEDGSLALVAEGGGGLVGDLVFKNGKRGRMAHCGLFGIAVNEGWRGVGLGRFMIRTLLDWAWASPLIEKVSLGVFAENTAARRLYESMGFVEEGRRLREFKLGPGRYADDIVMCLYTKPGVAPAGFATHLPGERP